MRQRGFAKTLRFVRELERQRNEEAKALRERYGLTEPEDPKAS
jgi:hypothetical protein